MNLETGGAQAHALRTQKYQWANIGFLEIVGANHFTVSSIDLILTERHCQLKNFRGVKQALGVVFKTEDTGA